MVAAEPAGAGEHLGRWGRSSNDVGCWISASVEATVIGTIRTMMIVPKVAEVVDQAGAGRDRAGRRVSLSGR